MSSSSSTIADNRSSVDRNFDLEKGTVGVHGDNELPPQVGPNGSVAPAAGSSDAPVRGAETEKSAGEKTDADWEVKWEPGEKANPMNWSVARKCWLTFASGLLVLNASFASSAPSATVASTMAELGIKNRTVGTLIISLFVAGYCVGPLLWGPMSEVFGRRYLFIIAFILYTGFQVGCALSSNTASILIFRLLGGMAASNPMTNSGGVMGDIWEPKVRGMAISIFVIGPFAGPSLGPLIGGIIETKKINWTWIYWILTIFAFVCLLVVTFGVPETYGPVLLKHKAQRLRKETGNPYWAPLERKKGGIKTRLHACLVQPFKMLIQEPMLGVLTLYMSFIYGLLYLDFVAMPIIFEQGHGFSPLKEGLMFLPLFVGAVIAAGFNAFYFNPSYIRKSSAYPPWQAPPELRLDSAIIGAFFIPISVFWLGFTSYPSVHWAAPMMSNLFLGAGLIFVFLSLFNYIIDCYLFAAATALAANTVVRSAFGAGFPLFANQMYVALNPRFAGLLLGCLASLFVPIPLLLLKYGPKLRAMSKNSAKRP